MQNQSMISLLIFLGGCFNECRNGAAIVRSTPCVKWTWEQIKLHWRLVSNWVTTVHAVILDISQITVLLLIMYYFVSLWLPRIKWKVHINSQHFHCCWLYSASCDIWFTMTALETTLADFIITALSSMSFHIDIYIILNTSFPFDKSVHIVIFPCLFHCLSVIIYRQLKLWL